MKFYYGIDLVDVIQGRGPAPSFVLVLIEGLPSGSMTAALAGGGTHLTGWSEERWLLAGIYDALNLNTRATGNWEKGKAPKFEPWPRPTAKDRTDEGRKKVTVADLYNRLAK